jgi:hypothetical protein
MGLQNSDLILVERSNTIYKETYGNRANIDSSDLLLVERNNTLYKCAYADWPDANSTDLILVERNNTLYKETKSNWPTTSYTDIHSANHMITLGTLLYNQGDDSTNNYSVVEVQVEVSSSAAYADGDLYIGFRNTAPTAWQGDLPIAAVQILESDGSTVRVTDWHDCTWNFALGNTQAGYYDWATTRYQDTLESNPENASGGYYGCPTNCIDDSKTKWRFSFTDDGTGSSHVGAAKGIPSTSYGGGPAYTGNPSTTSILPVGNQNVAQTGPSHSSYSTDGYLFAECSGTSTNDVTWLQLLYTGNIYNGDRIRICYYGGGNGQSSSVGLQTTNSLYIRFIEED